MAANDVTEPAVRVLIAAINAGDRAAFFAALTPDATMSDDGTDRDLAGWADRRSSPCTATPTWSRRGTAAGR